MEFKYWAIQTGKYSFGKNTDEALSIYGLDGGLQKIKNNKTKQGNIPNTPMLYIDVNNIDETIKLIKENNGTIIKNRTDMYGMGFIAHAKDIEGGLIGVWQNNSRDTDKNIN